MPQPKDGQRYVIRGTTGDSRSKERASMSRNVSLMREHSVKFGERRVRSDGRVLTVLGPAQAALKEGGVLVRYEDGSEAILWPRTIALMPDEGAAARRERELPEPNEEPDEEGDDTEL